MAFQRGRFRRGRRFTRSKRDYRWVGAPFVLGGIDNTSVQGLTLVTQTDINPGSSGGTAKIRRVIGQIHPALANADDLGIFNVVSFYGICLHDVDNVVFPDPSSGTDITVESWQWQRSHYWMRMLNEFGNTWSERDQSLSFDYSPNRTMTTDQFLGLFASLNASFAANAAVNAFGWYRILLEV